VGPVLIVGGSGDGYVTEEMVSTASRRDSSTDARSEGPGRS
jgi:hypothetical protein